MNEAIPMLQLLRDPDRGRRILDSLANRHAGVFRELLDALENLIPDAHDPDMTLNNLERFLNAAPERIPALLAQDAAGMANLVQLIGTSQFFADVLVADTDFFDMMRVPLRQSPTLDELRRELESEVEGATSDAELLRAFRRFRRRHALRIGSNDITRDRPLEEITADLSTVADAAIGVALDVARRHFTKRYGEPRTAAGTVARLTTFAFGKLGGRELNYSSDIDLLFVYDEDGSTGRVDNAEFFARVIAEFVRLLSAHTDRGQAYRVDLRLRPEGERGPLARSLASTLSYYDSLGRTWERQALIKLRPVAGDEALGAEFLRLVEPFVYRKYLSFAEINEIKAMKRRIERKATSGGGDRSDVKTGRGGIRDIEFTVQFLQLLNGGDLVAMRTPNTILAMQALEAAGCLTSAEFQILDDAYRFLRRTEHRLQLLFDWHTHRLPSEPDALWTLARRMGYRGRLDRQPGHAPPARASRRGPRGRRAPVSDAPPAILDTRNLLIEPLDLFLHDFHEKTGRTRQILDHLLHQAFAGAAEDAEPESDLLLDPNPDADTVNAVLGRYSFKDIPAAYRNLIQLGQEEVPFLSTRRCRHFLASIAPALLHAIDATPDPDATLTNLERVTASLGAKAVLWESFSFSPPSLRLTIDLCAHGPLLTEILISNPGMIDELLDSLLLNRPRTIDELAGELAELCRGAEDPAPILRSFRDKELLRIGMDDMRGRTTIHQTNAALSDLAETILRQVLRMQEYELQKRYGVPRVGDAPCRYALVALGKLGGQEITYHSDLDVILIYEGDGQTAGETPTDNLHFFTELAQHLIRALAAGDSGKLYAVDMRLRPTGKSGSLATPLAEFRRYYASPATQIWERQSLLRARIIEGDAAFAAQVIEAIRDGAYGMPWSPAIAADIRSMRDRVAAGRHLRDLKRGLGGIIDIEFLVQLFQLKYGRTHPPIQSPNTVAALDALHDAGLLDDADHAGLRTSYEFLRQAESRLRVVTNRTLDELPESCDELERLARHLGYEPLEYISAAGRFLAALDRHTIPTHDRFNRLIDRERE
jgi:glutamate-ammonia-ligase adenylyltransferase